MLSIVGSVVVVILDMFGNMFDVVNDYILKFDKEYVRCVSFLCIWDSLIWSFVWYICENFWYCLDSICYILNSGNSYFFYWCGKFCRGCSGIGFCFDCCIDGKWNRSKS